MIYCFQQPSKVQVLRKVLEVIKRDGLLKNAEVTGEILLKGLRTLEVIS